MVSSRGASKRCLATFVERKSRLYTALLIPDRTAATMQRGSYENSNGLLREFYPVKTDLAKVNVFKLSKFGFDFTTTELFTLVLGMVVAFLVSIIVIKFLMSYIKRHDFKVFGWYRIVLGAVFILYFSTV